MRIASIDFYLVNLGLSRPYRTAYKTVDHVENAVAVVTLENGIRGAGTANPSALLVGEDAGQAFSALENWDRDILVNRDIRGLHDCLDQLHRSLAGHPGARAALDLALYDAFTQWLEVPLVQFLGQQIPYLHTSITVGIKGVSDTLREASEYLKRGFRCLKLKLGTSVDEDVERVARVRELAGKHIRIRVDLNQAYTPPELLAFYDRIADLQVELIEQPLSVADTAKMKELPMNVRRMLAADESLVDAKDAFQLVSYPESCGIFNIKLMKCGGIRPALEIAGVAALTDTDLMWGCNDESMLSIAGALHAAMSCRKTRYLDLDGSLDLIQDIAEEAFVLKDGIVSVTGRPGIGWKKLLI